MFSLKDTITVTLVLFSVIDILGSIPLIIDLRRKSGTIQSGRATIVSGVIMISFLFIGETILAFLNVDIASFAIAGALVIFLIGLEMVLGKDIFNQDHFEGSTSSIVPLAFPVIAGAGSMTTIITMKAETGYAEVIVGVIVNLMLVYAVLKTSGWLEKKLGTGGLIILRKVFGIILIAIAVKIIKSSFEL